MRWLHAHRASQDLLVQLLHATRPTAGEQAAAAAACTTARSAIAARLPGWLHALPSDQGQRVKEAVLVLMAELEHLEPADRARICSCCLTGLEEARPHACTVLELLPPCLLLIPPGAPTSASQEASQRGAVDALEGEGVHQGTPPMEPSMAHRWGRVRVA